MVVFVSEHAHYSVARAVSLLGLGGANAIRVPSDERHAMDPAELERLLDDERRPVVAVVATSGSTAVGAFDDLARSAGSAPSAASGCTWTARTAPRRCSRTRTGTGWPASSRSARWPGIRTR